MTKFIQVTQDQWADFLNNSHPRAYASEPNRHTMCHRTTPDNLHALVVYPTAPDDTPAYFHTPTQNTDTPTLFTPEQIEAIRRLHARHDSPLPLPDFYKTAQSTFHMDDALVLPFNNIYLAIETDGYTHS